MRNQAFYYIFSAPITSRELLKLVGISEDIKKVFVSDPQGLRPLSPPCPSLPQLRGADLLKLWMVDFSDYSNSTQPYLPKVISRISSANGRIWKLYWEDWEKVSQIELFSKLDSFLWKGILSTSYCMFPIPKSAKKFQNRGFFLLKECLFLPLAVGKSVLWFIDESFSVNP